LVFIYYTKLDRPFAAGRPDDLDADAVGSEGARESKCVGILGICCT